MGKQNASAEFASIARELPPIKTWYCENQNTKTSHEYYYNDKLGVERYVCRECAHIKEYQTK